MLHKQVCRWNWLSLCWLPSTSVQRVWLLQQRTFRRRCRETAQGMTWSFSRNSFTSNSIHKPRWLWQPSIRVLSNIMRSVSLWCMVALSNPISSNPTITTIYRTLYIPIIANHQSQIAVWLLWSILTERLLSDCSLRPNLIVNSTDLC